METYLYMEAAKGKAILGPVSTVPIRQKGLLLRCSCSSTQTPVIITLQARRQSWGHRGRVGLGSRANFSGTCSPDRDRCLQQGPGKLLSCLKAFETESSYDSIVPI